MMPPKTTASSPAQSLAYLVVIISMVVFTARSALMLTCGDTGWHVLTGQLIRSAGSLPITDSWSFASHGKEWLNNTWIWDIAISIIHDLRGDFSLLLAYNILLHSLLVGLLVRFSLLRGASPFAVFLYLAPFIVGYSFGLAVRPQQVTQAFVLVLMFLTLPEPRLKFSWLVAPPLCLVWVNAHGGFLLGFGWILATVLETLFYSRGRNWKIALALVTAVLVSLWLNPYGPGVVQRATQSVTANNILSIVSEWQPMDFSPKFIPHWCFLFVAGTFTLVGCFDRRLQWREVVFALAFIYGAVNNQRHLSLAAIFSFLPTLYGIERCALLASSRVQGWWRSRDTDFRLSLAKPNLHRTVTVIVTSLSICVIAAGASGLLPRTLAPELSEPDVTAEMSKYPGRRWLNWYYDGGALLYHSKGRLPIFIDGRADTVYPIEIQRAYLRFIYLEPGWEDVIAQEQITGAVLLNDGPWIRDLRDRLGWRVAYVGSRTILLPPQHE